MICKLEWVGLESELLICKLILVHFSTQIKITQNTSSPKTNGEAGIRDLGMCIFCKENKLHHLQSIIHSLAMPLNFRRKKKRFEFWQKAKNNLYKIIFIDTPLSFHHPHRITRWSRCLYRERDCEGDNWGRSVSILIKECFTWHFKIDRL